MHASKFGVLGGYRMSSFDQHRIRWKIQEDAQKSPETYKHHPLLQGPFPRVTVLMGQLLEHASKESI